MIKEGVLDTLEVNYFGVAGVLTFYLLILVVGLVSARYKNHKLSNQDLAGTADVAITGGRSIGTCVGIFTMTATWVAGGYVLGSAEAIYSKGLMWCQLPFGYSISLIIGGLMFAKPMRDRMYTTMLDPFQEKYGATIGGLLYFPALFGEIFWAGVTLRVLGITISVVLGLNITLCIVVSSAVVIVYTFFGGLFSVAYTDVVQLFCVFIGLVIPISFIADSPYVNHSSNTTYFEAWRGEVKPNEWGLWIDVYLLLIFGGIPWQAYFQRVLSARTSKSAQKLSILAGFGCLLMSIPPITIGVLAKGADWDAANFSSWMVEKNPAVVLPAAIQYLTPRWVTFIGLGAVSAAVMSSCDSCILSSSSLFTHNIYKTVFRQQASQAELMWVLRFAIIIYGIIGTGLAISVNSIYGLFTLCSDLLYVILFPQLVCVLYMNFVNSYGVLTGYAAALILRLLSGEQEFGFPAAIHYPGYENGTQNFPHRTLTMIANFAVTILVSVLTNALFEKEMVPKRYDKLNAVVSKGHIRSPSDSISLSERRSKEDGGNLQASPLL